MTENEFSEKILKSSRNHWVFTLAGSRNLGFKKAKLVSQLFDTDIEIWMDSNRAFERREAWNKFSGKGAK